MRIDRVSWDVYLLMMGVPFFCGFSALGVIENNPALIGAGTTLLFICVGCMFFANTASRQRPDRSDIVFKMRNELNDNRIRFPTKKEDDTILKQWRLYGTPETQEHARRAMKDDHEWR